MAVKNFLINPNRVEINKEELEEVRKEKEKILLHSDIVSNQIAKSKFTEHDNLIHVHGRVVVKVDVDFKNSYSFQNGTSIRLERKYNNFNRRETQPVNVIVISGENIPANAEILVDHNSIHETNRINDYKNNFEHAESDKIRYYSIPTEECFAWREEKGDWQPLPPYEFGLRVFQPYTGVMQGIEPTLITDTLYVTTGEYKGNIVKTLVACDYQIVFQGDNGREKYLIRFRPNGDSNQRMEPEAIAILDELNLKYKNGDLLIGYSSSDAVPIKQNELLPLG